MSRRCIEETGAHRSFSGAGERQRAGADDRLPATTYPRRPSVTPGGATGQGPRSPVDFPFLPAPGAVVIGRAGRSSGVTDGKQGSAIERRWWPFRAKGPIVQPGCVSLTSGLVWRSDSGDPRVQLARGADPRSIEHRAARHPAALQDHEGIPLDSAADRELTRRLARVEAARVPKVSAACPGEPPDMKVRPIERHGGRPLSIDNIAMLLAGLPIDNATGADLQRRTD